jgi:hypothetical protein
MTQRITDAHLEAKVRIVNGLLGYPDSAGYGTDGLVVLYGAYGGTGVHVYSGPHGGHSDLMGYCGTKREAALFLSGMIAALRAVQDR